MATVTIRRVAARLAAALLAGCRPHPAVPAHGGTPGDRLEAAAVAAGLVTDPARTDPVGSYARGGDRMCVVPQNGSGGYRVGLVVQYDDGQGCLAHGTATRDGDRLRIGLTDENRDDCHVAARFEGDRIVFPAVLPPACDRRCTGRASLAALTVERLSAGAAEAGAQRDAGGAPLCG